MTLRQLKVGDIVRQNQNKGWWWMSEDRGNMLIGLCVIEPIGGLGGLWSVSNFEKHPYNRGVELIDPDDVPDEIWALIAERRLLGEDDDT